MNPVLIALAVFVLALAVIAVLCRHSTLEQLPPLPNERVLFEEVKVRVEQGGGPRGVVFYRCTVRVTDRRIVIAQAALLQRSRPLRYVIEYGDAVSPATCLQRGYLELRVRKSAVAISAADPATVRIAIPDSPLTGGQHLTYPTTVAGEYRQLFG